MKDTPKSPSALERWNSKNGSGRGGQGVRSKKKENYVKRKGFRKRTNPKMDVSNIDKGTMGLGGVNFQISAQPRRRRERRGGVVRRKTYPYLTDWPLG